MPGDLMRLYVTIRQRCRGIFWSKRMTSEERREARYKRRKEIRAARKKERCASFDDFGTVFSYDHLYRSYKKCRRGVAWKASVQKYITQAPLLVNTTYTRLEDGSFRSSGFYEFDLHERGKKRHIKSVTMGERVVQRCLCDNALVPMMRRTLIYDNGASLENKGYHFTLRRLQMHLEKHYRKHGKNGYILLFDFSKFFDNISHQICMDALWKEFTDRKIIGLTKHFIDCFGDVGLGLGSQISQTFALTSANRLDHYIKEVLQIKGYGRYMDDGYLIHESKEYLQKCLDDIRRICRELHITLNEKKTQIVKLSHGFSYLQARIYIMDSGRILKKIPRKSVTRMRRKLKSFVGLLESGTMGYTELYIAYQGWKQYAEQFSAYKTIQTMGNLYDDLFIKPWKNFGGGRWYNL